jgi:3',5'-nucleoside bisphosphate phosphatase
MIKIDLHMHSLYSDDGEFTPEELSDICLASNLKAFAVTDHNNTNSIASLLNYCKGKNITVIPGIEIDCMHKGRLLHILGYGIDYNDPVYDSLWTDYLQKQQLASKKRVDLVRKLGVEFSDERIVSLARFKIITGEVIAEAAMEYDLDKKNPILQPYYKGGNRSDNPYVNFYWDICSQDKPAYSPINFISLDKAIGIIKKSGGYSILAHPGINVQENTRLLDSIISCGVDGIEAFSSYHDIRQSEFYYKYTLKYNLLATCGSDFHGKTKPKVKIGHIDCYGHESSLMHLTQVFSRS